MVNSAQSGRKGPHAAANGAPAPSIRHISAGPEAMARLASLLGLADSAGGWRLTGLCCHDGVKISLCLGHGEHRLDLDILPSAAGPVVASKAGLGLLARGADGPAVRKLLMVLAAKLGSRGFASIVRALEKDPLSFVEQISLRGDGDLIKVPCIGQPMSLLREGWRNFYADQDFEVLLGVPSCSDSRTVNIEYADLECYYARPRRDFNKWTFLDWPEECEQGGGDGDVGAPIVTELSERDMIMGTGERADALVEEVRKRAKAGNVFLFTHLCTPIVMGEDFAGLARRCEAEVEGTAVRWSQKDRDDNDNFGDHFSRILGRPGFFDAPADPSSLNLFHFPPRYRDVELRPFLAKLGLAANVCMLPDVSLSSIERIPAARWQVFCERSSYPTRLRELIAASDRPVLQVPAPYGLAGTRECLRAIAEGTGTGQALAQAWSETTASFLPAWEEMVREASGYSLAFVASESTLPRLTSLRYGYGAPLATMVREMGFGVHILYYDLHGAPPRLPDGLEDAAVAVFRSPWELARRLKEGRFHAVYSDVVFDRRLTEAGKARFSARDFEMGLGGAARTLGKLLSVCRLPFFRRYADHLARSPGGDDVV